MKQKKLEKNARSDGKKKNQPAEKLADQEPEDKDTEAKSSSVVSLGKLGRVES